MFLENLGASTTTNTDFLQDRRKTPRCVMSFDLKKSEAVPALLGLKAVWQDRTETRILGLNLSGLVLAREGGLAEMLKKTKTARGQVFQADLKCDLLLPDSRQTLAVRILDATDLAVSGMFDAISAGGRLHLPQELKDQIVVKNWSRRDPKNLELQFQNSYWFHAPFDTNLVITSEGSGLIDYDGLLLKWTPQGSHIFKSVSSVSEGENYSAMWTQPPGAKVSMGSSWKDRWFRLLDMILKNEQMDPLLDSQSLAILQKSLASVKAI